MTDHHTLIDLSFSNAVSAISHRSNVVEHVKSLGDRISLSQTAIYKLRSSLGNVTLNNILQLNEPVPS